MEYSMKHLGSNQLKKLLISGFETRCLHNTLHFFIKSFILNHDKH